MSVSKQELTQKLITSLKDNCHPTGQVDQEIGNIKFKLSGDAKCNNMVWKNQAAVASHCELDDTLKTLAEGAAKLTEQQKAGLGLNLSADVQQNMSVIRDEIEKNCASASAIKQTITGVDFEIADNASCDLLEFMNSADAQAVCISKLVSDNMSKLSDEATVTQTGYDPLAVVAAVAIVLGLILLLFFGGMGKMLLVGGVMILVGIILVIIGGVLWNKAIKHKQSTRMGIILTIIGAVLILIGLIIALMSGSKTKNKN